MIFFKIFSSCLIVKGASRSIICDLQRQKFEFIPNDMVLIVGELSKRNSISSIINKYGKQDKKIILEYLDFLEQKEYGFYCNEEDFDRFPLLNTNFDTSSTITNSVIELSKKNITSLEVIIPQLEHLLCDDVVIIFYEEINHDTFKKIFSYFKDSCVKSLEIISKFYSKIDNSFFKRLNSYNSRLTRVTFYCANEDKIEYWDKEFFFDRILTKKNITSFKSCGKVHSKYFNVNLMKVTEAINFNSCLHKKISIDIKGDIRNCPAISNNYGNIKDTKLIEVVHKKKFKQYWNLNKDKIEKCKDCEFRYICTDCRAFIENPKNLLSPPLKCGYNPYTNEWKEWSKNPLKIEKARYYGILK